MATPWQGRPALVPWQHPDRLLPERAQQLIGEGVINLAAVDQLRAIGAVAPTCWAGLQPKGAHDGPSLHRKPPTEKERDARRRADRERIEQAARELLTTEGWQRWIKVRASNGLSRYSVSNQMLIALDCWSRDITPTYVAGFRAFFDLNRCVRKGEKAIRILAPVTVKQRDDNGEETGEKKVFFRTVPVFDVSMTDPLPGQQPVPLSQPITGDSHHHLIAPLVAHAAELGYTVEFRQLPEDGPAGWCDAKRKQIVVATGPANRQVRTLTHEIAYGHGLGYAELGRERCEVLVDCVIFWRARSTCGVSAEA